MSTTLTELHRHTAKVMGQVVHGNQTVTIQIHGKDSARISPMPGAVDRKKALAALREFGKVWTEAGCMIQPR